MVDSPHYRITVQYSPSGNWIVELQQHMEGIRWRHIDEYATDNFNAAHTQVLDWMLRLKDQIPPFDPAA